MGRATEFLARRNGDTGRIAHLAYAPVGGGQHAAQPRHAAVVGPLEREYSEDTLTSRQKAAGRLTQVIVSMNAARKAGNTAEFARLKPRFLRLADRLEGIGYGIMLFDEIWPTTLEIARDE